MLDFLMSNPTPAVQADRIPDGYLTKAQAAQFLGVAEKTIDRMAKRHDVQKYEHQQPGRTLICLFLADELKRIKAARQASPPVTNAIPVAPIKPRHNGHHGQSDIGGQAVYLSTNSTNSANSANSANFSDFAQFLDPTEVKKLITYMAREAELKALKQEARLTMREARSLTRMSAKTIQLAARDGRVRKEGRYFNREDLERLAIPPQPQQFRQAAEMR